MTPRMYALWMAQPVLQAVVVGVLLWRKRHKSFPVFFFYLISQVAVFAITFITFQMENYPLRFYSYWICQAISLAIGFKVIQEVFLDVFRPYPALKDLGSVMFKWAALVMLLVAGVVAAASSVSSAGPLVQAVLTVERCVRVVQIGLIMFLLVFSKYLGVSWRQQSFGIALGFGISASVHLATWAVVANADPNPNVRNLLAFLNMAVYHLSVLIWYYFLLVPAKDHKKPPTAPTNPPSGSSGDHEETLEDWNRELERLIHQ